MNWDGNFQAALAAPARSADSSLSFVYHYNYSHSEGMAFAEAATAAEPLGTKRGRGSNPDNKAKKRLSSHQLDRLEESFQEGIKLDPERKMKLSRELGIEPRQVAVWFQNRRARWKTKQMELLYDELRQEFNITCKEKLRLQEEALKLKAILRDRAVAGKKQLLVRLSGEDTVGSSSMLPASKDGLYDCRDTDASIGLYGSDDYNATTHPYLSSV
ncbi:hypothetical protein MLD38_032661 [Melastoma candidum]|uniref:Uncharacterized protein n=1 Tax=Melastoma candidum TaxID=119954 RepID=A0ACB9M4V8_9MYRT|nr:hypothetical protein MLD38_032661 [Melastoma candidum]